LDTSNFLKLLVLVYPGSVLVSHLAQSFLGVAYLGAFYYSVLNIIDQAVAVLYNQRV
jgi:hypothetical protein